MRNRNFLEIFIILLVSGFIMMFNLGGIPLLDPDEPVYAQTASEMLAARDFISPRIYGDFWYDKPPMYYWLVAGAYKIFGQSEMTARLPSALLAIGTTLLVYYAGRKVLNNRAAFFAGLALATSLEYFYLGKAAVTDMTLTFFLTASLLSFIRERYYFAFASAALAVVTKGPVGIVFLVMIILAHAVLLRNFSVLKRARVFSGGLLFLAIAAPWYLAMYHYHGTEFIDTFLGFHNVTRFLQPEHPSGKLWYFYIPVLVVGFFPWTAFLIQAVRAAWKERRGSEGSALSFFIIWALIVFAFFTASQTKLVSYILPMYPPLALMVGWYIDKICTEGKIAAFKKAALILTLLMIIFEGALIFTSLTISRDLLPGAVAEGVVFAVVLAGLWLAVKRRNGAGFVSALVVGMGLFAAVLMTQLFPAAAPIFSMKDIAGVFRQHYDGQVPVYVAKFYRPGFAYYTGIPGVELNNDRQIEAAAASPGKAMIIVQEKAYEKLPVATKQNLTVIAMQGGKVLLAK